VIGVIGGTGGIGRQVLSGLLTAGVPVRAVVRDEPRARALIGPGPQYAVADLADDAALDPALDGLSSLFLVSPVGPDMVRLQGGVIDAAARAGVEHIARISSIAVGDASMDTQFARWHGQLDEHLESSGVRWTHLRPSNFMRNLLAFAGLVRATGQLRAPLGQGRICFIDDADIAAVAVAALTDPVHRDRCYILTGSQWQTYHEVAGIIAEVTGHRVSYVPVTLDHARDRWRQLGHPDWFVDDLTIMYRQLASASVSPVTSDVAAVTGRPPRGLRQFVAAHAPAFTPQPA
jgi:uncharacterized protein YbjT (DUF2867 family)